MTSDRAAILAGLMIAATAVGPAAAHHSFPATYHVDQTSMITGEVVQFAFRNPHSFVHVMVKNKAGVSERWAVEWGGGATLARDNVTSSTLKPGDTVTIIGNPGRVAGEHRMRMNKITRPSDGWTWGGTFG